MIKRTLKRMDLTSRTFFALVEPGNAFAGTLLELALASDRIYMLNDPDKPNTIALSDLNRGAYPMSNGLSRLEVRFLGEPERVAAAFAHDGPFSAEDALDAGLVSFAPDDLDWEDEVRLAIEERAALSPDALTGMEANLRFAGPETLETKIFGRLTACELDLPAAERRWRWRTQTYGREGRPEFDWRRRCSRCSSASFVGSFVRGPCRVGFGVGGRDPRGAIARRTEPNGEAEVMTAGS